MAVLSMWLHGPVHEVAGLLCPIVGGGDGLVVWQVVGAVMVLKLRVGGGGSGTAAVLKKRHAKMELRWRQC